MHFIFRTSRNCPSASRNLGKLIYIDHFVHFSEREHANHSSSQELLDQEVLACTRLFPKRTRIETRDSRVFSHMNTQITSVDAYEILDFRGNPTLRVQITLSDGRHTSASVPSGASTGENEALELRDGDKARYGGKGVLRAAANVTELIAPRLKGLDPAQQVNIDRLMIESDGTEDKSQLGANAILGVSMAVACAGALSAGQPLYAYLGRGKADRLPVPMMNVINGGSHADNSLGFQEFMLVPHGAPTFAEALRYGVERAVSRPNSPATTKPANS